MPEILDERPNHLLILNDDGGTEMIPLSDHNRLLYKHGLFGLLRDESEAWAAADGDDRVLVTPLGNNQFEIEMDEMTVVTTPYEKPDLVTTLVEAYEADDAPSPWPVINGVMAMRDFDAHPGNVDPLAEIPTFADAVEVRENGWYINDHLMLSYNNEFRHEHIASHERSGDDVRALDSDQTAYELRFQRQMTLDDATNTRADDAEFIARAKWAVDHTES